MKQTKQKKGSDESTQKFACVLEFDFPCGGSVSAKDAQKALAVRIANCGYTIKIYVHDVQSI